MVGAAGRGAHGSVKPYKVADATHMYYTHLTVACLARYPFQSLSTRLTSLRARTQAPHKHRTQRGQGPCGCAMAQAQRSGRRGLLSVHRLRSSALYSIELVRRNGRVQSLFSIGLQHYSKPAKLALEAAPNEQRAQGSGHLAIAVGLFGLTLRREPSG